MLVVLAGEKPRQYPGESDRNFRSLVCMHIGHIESTPQNMGKLRDSEYANYWTRATKSDVEGHTAIRTYSDKKIP